MAVAVRDEGKKVNSNINVTPMVDVMLVLLIIFMVITPMLQNKVQIDMAQVDNASAMPDADKKPAPDKGVTPKKTLWDRLGGEANVRKVIDDFAKAAAADPKVNLTRDGKYKLDEASVKFLENQLVDLVSTATGGPLRYSGKNMKEAHKGMGITNAEYDAAGAHLKKALEQNGAKAADVADVMQAVERLRQDIVEAKE